MSMSTMKDYNAEEWKAISAAPVAAGLLITLADASGPVGITKEAMAVGKAITATASGDTPEVVRALAESVKTSGGRPELPNVPTGDRAKAKDALLGTITSAVRAVENKSGGEVSAYKSWLVSVGTKGSEASKESGFLGSRGTLVSTDEQNALRQLSDILGVTAPPLRAQS